MAADNDFYVGYMPNAPKRHTKVIRAFILTLGILLISLATFLVLSQRGFKDSSFELGQWTEVEGILSMAPVPLLKVEAGTDFSGKSIYQSILLIGFGKFGAEPTLEKMEAAQGQTLLGKKLKLRGTLIYYDGKTLMELTEGAGALIAVEEAPPIQEKVQILGKVQLKGEIADPKCFFGVMKPGEGKPHLSCAVRCISGGIPPVLKTENIEGETNYFLLRGPNGEAINKEILDKVGIAVSLSGALEQVGDWAVLKLEPTQVQPIHSELLDVYPTCKDQLTYNY